MNISLISILLFVGLALVFAAVCLLIRDLLHRRAAAVHERFASGDSGARPEIPIDAELAAARNADQSRMRWFRQMVLESGTQITADAGLLLSLAVGLLVGGAIFLWREDPLFAIIGLLVGMAVTVGFFAFRRARRRRAILIQLPEVTETLARAVRAGESLDQAMALVGSTAAEPLRGEFRRAAGQMEMGLSLEMAMRTLTRRNRLSEMRILASALMIYRRTGGDLPTTLDRLAALFRERLSSYRQFLASTAAARGGAILIALIGAFAVLFIVTVQPEYVRTMLDRPVGRLMLLASVGLLVLGSAWAFWILRPEY